MLEEWMKQNNISARNGYEMANHFTMTGKVEEIKYSDILFGKRIQCKPFCLGYQQEPNNKYSIAGNKGYGSRIELSEVDFLEYAKSELSKYNEWYAKASYPKRERKQDITIKSAQTKLFPDDT